MALSSEQPGDNAGSHEREKEFFIHNLLVRINVTIEMIGEERRLRREGPDGAHCLLWRVETPLPSRYFRICTRAGCPPPVGKAAPCRSGRE